MKCPFYSEFGKWIECPHLYVTAVEPCGMCMDQDDGDTNAGTGGAWCTMMIGRAMLAHKTWIGNDY